MEIKGTARKPQVQFKRTLKHDLWKNVARYFLAENGQISLIMGLLDSFPLCRGRLLYVLCKYPRLN